MGRERDRDRKIGIGIRDRKFNRTGG